MSSAFAIAEIGTMADLVTSAAGSPLQVDALRNEHEAEVLAFLSQRPLHTVFLASLIDDNGVECVSNRGAFYGFRNPAGRLSGVALIGEKTVIETQDHVALKAFARLELANTSDHLIRGEQSQIEILLASLERAGRTPGLICSEILLEQREPDPGIAAEPNLRLAGGSEIGSVVSINAAMACEENGTNPLVKDPAGLWKRVARRIDQGRVWVLVDESRTIFKADIVSETSEVAFVEGVYVCPEERRKGHGLRCMTQLARHLLRRVKSVCLVVNEANQRALALYQRAGYKVVSNYNTAYFTTV